MPLPRPTYPTPAVTVPILAYQLPPVDARWYPPVMAGADTSPQFFRSNPTTVFDLITVDGDRFSAWDVSGFGFTIRKH